MISLKKYSKTEKSPFEQFPQLKNIWNRESSQQNAEESIERFHTFENGEIFLIIKDKEVIGISGYYFTKDSFGLRWHGIIPQERSKGYSKIVIDLIIERLKNINSIHYPYMQELIPEKRHEELSKIFKSYGFVKASEATIHNESPSERTFKYIKSF